MSQFFAFDPVRPRDRTRAPGARSLNQLLNGDLKPAGETEAVSSQQESISASSEVENNTAEASEL